jgi:hypothetical protein
MKARISVSIFLIHVLALIIFFFLPTIIPSENGAIAYAATRKVYAPVYMSYEKLWKPVTSGSAQPLKEMGKIYVKDNFIFINELYKGVHIINNQDPAKPETIAFINIPGNVDIAIRDDILYADSWIDLVVVDISNPANVSEIKRIEGIFPNLGPPFLFMEENVRFERIDSSKGIVVGWEFVYTETYYRSGACFPSGTEVLTANGSSTIETVKPGTEVYACDPSSGEWILAKVLKRREYDYDGDMITIQMDSIKIQANGNHPFYVLSGEQLESRPLPQDIPEEDLEMVGPGRWVEARDLTEGDVLRSKGDEGLVITSLSNRDERTKVYNLEIEGYHNFAVHQTGILVHNKKRAATPSPSTGKGGSLARFTIVDDYLYTISGSDLQLFDIKNPANPYFWNKIKIGWDIETIFPYHEKLFIGGQAGMYIYDNSDPAQPVKISRFAHVTSCDPVVVENNYAYVTLRGGTRCGGRNNSLEIINIGNIYNPELIASYPMDSPYGLGIDRGLLFICDGDSGLKLFDASKPKELKKVGGFSGIKTHDVILHNGIAIVVGQKGLYQYDYQDLESVTLISEIVAQDVDF